MRLFIDASMQTSSHHISGPRILGSSARRVELALLCAVAGGCATIAPPPLNAADARRLAEVSALAGKPVVSFRFERMSSYEPIGLADLLVFTAPRDAWLLHLDGACRELDYSSFLGLTSYMHRVTSGFDSVRVRYNPIPCRIEQIRPVDTAVLKRADRENKMQDRAMDDASPSMK